jgi:UDP-N-acetylglucosamine 2-epimerase (non-hydrolysing)
VLLTLIRNAAGIVSDSGGIQEEATVLKRPVLVVRRSNERPEAEQAFGARTLPGPGISQIMTAWLRDTAAVDARLAGVPTPFGDGTASSRLIQAVRSRYSEGCPSPPIQACEGQNGIIGGRPAWLRSRTGDDLTN